MGDREVSEYVLTRWAGWVKTLVKNLAQDYQEIIGGAAIGEVAATHQLAMAGNDRASFDLSGVSRPSFLMCDADEDGKKTFADVRVGD